EGCPSSFLIPQFSILNPQSGASAPSPPCAARRVFEQDSARDERVAEAVALFEVARLARGVACLDHLLDFGVEHFVAAREDVEHGSIFISAALIPFASPAESLPASSAVFA